MNSAASSSSAHTADLPKKRDRSPFDYLPLAILVFFALLAASAKQVAYAGPWEMRSWMHDAMGLFLINFSMFKFFDLRAFADGFQRYDLLAGPVRGYAYLYPFLELGLGLGYLAQWRLSLIYGLTIGLMGFGALGVWRALRRKLDLECACMGTLLRVPLSTVTLTEDLGMLFMAIAMWVTES